MPPQVDEFVSKFKQFKFPTGIGLPLVVLILLVVFFGSSMFYTVAVDEVGVIQRFGKYTRTTQPGLNFKLPAGIEKVTKVKVRRVLMEEFGFRSAREGDRGRFISEAENLNVSLMLTGDLNVAVVPWIVQFRIKDPYEYLFKVDNVHQLLVDMSEAAMRMVVGDRSINEVITKREEIADEARRILQREMDNAEAGIIIVTVEMERTNVPNAVQPSFNEVNQAVQEREQLIYHAREDYNKEVPAARGEAERTIRAAEGYALDRVNRARGDASRFISVYQEYIRAPEVTKRRLYLEMMTEIYPRLDQKFIIDADQKNLLPLLNLEKQIGGVER